MMVGRSIDQLFPKAEAKIGEPLLELRDVSHGKVVRDVSFTLRAGEILGIAGLSARAAPRLALTIFGMTPATSGEILVDGKPVTIDSPAAGARSRHRLCAGRPRPAGPDPAADHRGKHLAHRAQEAGALRSSSTAARRTRSPAISSRGSASERAGPAQAARQLSGGNQQKVVLAKWLAAEPRILIMDEPTRGIDVGAKSEIHALMSRLAQNGLAILMISSELPEVLGMSDRVLVMNGGRIVAEIDRADATSETVGAAMTLAAREAEARMTDIAAAARDARLSRRLFEAYGQEFVVLARPHRAVRRRRPRQSALPVGHQPHQHLLRQCLYRGRRDRHVAWSSSPAISTFRSAR